MDKSTIINGLMAALSKGTGDIADLDDLLTRAKEDIDQVRKEETERARIKAELEAKAQKARGEAYAALAGRLLRNETTAEDVATVINSYAVNKNLKMDPIDAADAEHLIESAFSNASAAVNESLSNSIAEFVDALGELFSACLDSSNKSEDKID